MVRTNKSEEDKAVLKELQKSDLLIVAWTQLNDCGAKEKANYQCCEGKHDEYSKLYRHGK